MSETDDSFFGAIGRAQTTAAGIAQIEESVLSYEEIDHSSDRVCAIVTAAMLEGRIQGALSWRLPDPEYQKKKLFTVDGLLGPYDAKVNMGYALGIFGAEARENLFAIGSIRNRFAHRTYIRDFEHAELDTFFKKLTIYKRLEGMDKKYTDFVFPDPIPNHARHRERFRAAARTLDAYFV